MIVTERRLRRIIRASILQERKGASASDITRFKPHILDWAEILIDELAEAIPGIKEMSEKARINIVQRLTDTISVELVGLTSSMSASAMRRLDKKAEEKSHQEWDRKRKSRGATKYWGTS